MQGKQSAEGTTELTSFNPSPFLGSVADVFESGVPFHYTLPVVFRSFGAYEQCTHIAKVEMFFY
jgi:hypothetical protein